MKSAFKKFTCSVLSITMALGCTMTSLADWKKDDIGMWWEDADGYYPRAEGGELFIDVYLPDSEYGRQRYYFDSQGYLITNTTLHFESHFLNSTQTWDVKIGKNGQSITDTPPAKVIFPKPFDDSSASNEMLNSTYASLLGRDVLFAESILGKPVKIETDGDIIRSYADGSELSFYAGIVTDLKTPIGNVLNFTKDTYHPDELESLLGWPRSSMQWGGFPGSADYFRWTMPDAEFQTTLSVYGDPYLPTEISRNTICRFCMDFILID